MTRYDAIVSILVTQKMRNMSGHVWACQDMSWSSKTFDANWFDPTNMFRLVIIMLWYNLIGFFKHVQTCFDVMIRFDMIIYVSNMTRLVQNHKMTKYSKIWANGTKNVCQQSDSLDRFEQVERSKIVKKQDIKVLESYRLRKIWQHWQRFTNVDFTKIV